MTDESPPGGPVTVLDVAALASEQMRTAVALQAAREARRVAEEEWRLSGRYPFPTSELLASGDRLRAARRAATSANRAYLAACGEAIAELRAAPAAEQADLFDGGGS